MLEFHLKILKFLHYVQAVILISYTHIEEIKGLQGEWLHGLDLERTYKMSLEDNIKIIKIELK